MKRKIMAVLLGCSLVVASLAGCGGSKDEAAATDTKTEASDTKEEGASNDFKVAFVCSEAGQNDTGYNKSACDTLKEVAGELGVEYKIVEPTNGVAQALETLAADGYNLIFSLEYDFEALINGVGGNMATRAVSGYRVRCIQ